MSLFGEENYDFFKENESTKNTFEALPKGEYVAEITNTEMKMDQKEFGGHIGAKTSP